MDLLVRGRQVAGNLIAHQQGDLVQQAAEGFGGGGDVAHMRELMRDQRVVGYV